MRICKHLNDLQNTGVDLESHEGSIHGTLIQETNETVDLCDKCLDDAVITNHFKNSYSTWSAIRESEEWGLVGEQETHTPTPRKFTKTVYYQVTEAQVTHSWDVTGTSDEDILKKAKDIHIDIYLHDPNSPDGGHSGKEDAGCDSCNIEVAFDKADLKKLSQTTIIEGLVQRLHDVCPDDEGLYLKGSKICDMKELQKKYLSIFYVVETDVNFEIRFTGEFTTTNDEVVGIVFNKEDADAFADMKQLQYDKSGKI
jgi:hypothetical protein